MRGIGRLTGVAFAAVLVAACTGSPPPPEPDELASYPPLASHPAGETVTVSGAGDIARCDAEDDEATARLLDDLPGWVLAIGDNAYPDGSATDFERCYDPSWGRHLDRTLPVIGNHEWDTGGAAGYFGYFGERAGDPRAGWYATDLGAWRVIVLVSDCSRVGGCGGDSPQGRWLARELADHARTCTLAVWHHPLFSSGHHGPSPQVEPFWQVLYDAGVDLVVNAHEHSYERFERLDPSGRLDPARGIRQIVVGTGGGELRGFSRDAPGSAVRDGSTHGVLRLDLHDGAYDWTFIPVTPGATADTGSDTCH